MEETDSHEKESEQQPIFNIQRVYLKDASLEQPNAPAIFLQQEMPSIEIEVKVQTERFHNTIYESIVTAIVTARVKEKIAFLIEVSQAGIFDIQYIPNNQFEPLINIACPTIVFPYLRANVADLITRSGFPPIHLAEMNFQALYEQQIAIRNSQKSIKNGEDNNIVVDNNLSIKPH